MSTATAGSLPARHYWDRLVDDQGRWRDGAPPGEALSALRRGFDSEPGSVPGMWPFYTTLTGDGRVTASLRAEHLALAMFGLHQQSQSAPMHRADDGLGKAMARLRASERYSADAIDRRFTQAATATDLDELGHHVRGLTTMLKTIAPPQPIDYTRLFQDLCDWQRPDLVGRVRRRWGSDYFRLRSNPAEPGDPRPSTASSAGKDRS
jgi:CRISPR system Cascade subunit CasB